MRWWWNLLGTDACALGLLAVVSAGLGLFAQTACEKFPAVPTAPGAGGLKHPAPSLEEFHALVQAGKVPVFDVRSRDSYREGHVPGAVSLPAEDFYRAYARLGEHLVANKERLVLVYCSDKWCALGDEVQQKLVDQGHRHVGLFRDGWAGWVEAGLPTERQP